VNNFFGKINLKVTNHFAPGLAPAANGGKIGVGDQFTTLGQNAI
jgi:hypothetical protein